MRRIAPLIGILALAGCATGGGGLMNIRATEAGPDEFAILPGKPLQAPETYAALPPPTPGGFNRTDPTPLADAVVALGGRPGAAPAPVPASDGALVRAAASPGGIDPSVRAALAAEDQAFRTRNRGRLLERIFGNSRYYRVYRGQALDQGEALARARAAGLRTPAAPPVGLADGGRTGEGRILGPVLSESSNADLGRVRR